MSSASSGNWTGPTQTPTGQPFQHPITTSYVTKAEFIQDYVVKGLGITASDVEYTDGTLDQILLDASGAINDLTHRYFNIQTVDETLSRYTLGTGLDHFYVTLQLNNYPFNSINSIYFEVLGQFVPVSLTYLQNAYPDQGFLQIIPNLASAAGTLTPIPVETQLGTYWVNYTFGYSTIPSAIRRATILQAVKTIGFQRNVLGLSSFRTNQKTLAWGNVNKLDQEIDLLVMPYKRPFMTAA